MSAITPSRSLQTQHPLTNQALESKGNSKPKAQRDASFFSIASDRWLATGQLFTSPERSTKPGGYLFPEDLWRLPEDIKNAAIPTDKIIEQLNDMIHDANQYWSEENSLSGNDLDEINQFKTACNKQLAELGIGAPESTSHFDELNTLQNRMDELCYITDKFDVKRLDIAGAELLPELEVIADFKNNESLLNAIKTTRPSPGFSEFFDKTMDNIDALKRQITEEPKLLNHFRGYLHRNVDTTFKEAGTTLEVLSQQCNNPILREQLSDMANGIHGLPVHELLRSLDMNQLPKSPDLLTVKNLQYASQHEGSIGSLYFQDASKMQRMRLSHANNPRLISAYDTHKAKVFYPLEKINPDKWPTSRKTAVIEGFTSQNNISTRPKTGSYIYEYFKLNTEKNEFEGYHYSRGRLIDPKHISQKDIDLLYQGIKSRFNSNQLRLFIDKLIEDEHMLPALKQAPLR